MLAVSWEIPGDSGLFVFYIHASGSPKAAFQALALVWVQEE